jgi:PAS domain S-box-containing protein
MKGAKYQVRSTTVTEKANYADRADDPAPCAELTLRQRAEARALAKTVQLAETWEQLSPEAVRQLLHELHVHQIELEMQNEELRRTQVALEASRARYFDLYNLAPIGYFTLSEHGLILESNLTAAGLLGIARRELVKRPWSRFILPQDQGLYYQHYKELFETGTPRQWEMRMVRQDGSHFWVRVEATATHDSESGAPVCRATLSNITAHKGAEAALPESEARFRQVWETTSDAMALSDAEGSTLTANPAYFSLAGYTSEQLIGRSFAIIFPAEKRAHLVERYKVGFADAGPPPAVETLVRRADGTERIVEVHATFLTAAGERHARFSTLRDITARKYAEEALRASHHHLEATLDELHQAQMQLVQQERLTAVGQLAAGMAHDFNNILAVIVLQAQMGLHIPDLPGELYGRLEKITQQAKRAASLIQQLLDFGHRAVLELRLLDLAAFLKEQVDLLRCTLPEQIKLSLRHPPDACLINGDPTRIQQMLINLMFNARDAMPHGGELQISLKERRFEHGEATPLPDMAAGVWIQVTVRDTGTGMPPMVRQHLFELFFTTKEPAQGTGLGLAQVYGIVKQHNGHIGVQTQEGEGTTFIIYLPTLAAGLPLAPPVKTVVPP